MRAGAGCPTILLARGPPEGTIDEMKELQAIERLRRTLRPPREQLVQHEVYRRIKTRDDLRTLMKHHVFAVWDFMSLRSWFSDFCALDCGLSQGSCDDALERVGARGDHKKRYPRQSGLRDVDQSEYGGVLAHRFLAPSDSSRGVGARMKEFASRSPVSQARQRGIRFRGRRYAIPAILTGPTGAINCGCVSVARIDSPHGRAEESFHQLQP